MKIIIGADLVPTKISEPLFVEGDTEKILGDFLPMIKAADRFIVNLECALTDADTPTRKCGPNLKAAPACADTLKKLGVTDVMLSNNHTMDFGTRGLRDTMANLDRVGLPYTGIGENDTDSRKIYYFEQSGKKFGIVNVCEHEYCYALPNRMGTNPYDPYLTMHDIREAKKNADIVLVIYHGGKEYCRYPSPRLRLLCHEMVECGADVVITQHSHCVGCYETWEGGQILYGQGNLHFVAPSHQQGWFTSLLVELDIDDAGKITFGYYPMVMNLEEVSVKLATGDLAKEIMDGFYARNEEMKDGRWMDGWRAFCQASTYYLNMPKNAYKPDSTEQQNELFAHFLDCEAHEDVLRELFQTWHKTLR